MIGAIIGDAAGSVYEFNNIKTTDFPFFSRESNYTDDSVMTMAVAYWLLTDNEHTNEGLEKSMVGFANSYKCILGGYGARFLQWLLNDYSERKPYNSWGNGSAMRVSAVGWMFDTLEETERVAEISAAITHNHSEGIKGAQATAAAIFMARNGKSKQEIKDYITTKYGYNLNRTCDEIRPTYKFNESCQGTVPEAIIAFLESADYESAIRLGVSLGGDSDTLACITGGIAEAFYKEIPEEIIDGIVERLTDDFKKVLKVFYSRINYTPKYMEGKLEERKMPRYTPNHIGDLKDNEIFVFGSNLAGHHGGGAARAAMDKFGAIWGQGVGMQGRCYAIPTMQGGVETIKPYVDEFIEYARQHSEYKFLVTRIGCGIAGFKDEEIAPLFKNAIDLENVWLPKSFIELY